MTSRRLLASVCVLAALAQGAFAQQTPSPVSRTGGVTLSGRIVDAYPGAQPQPDAVLIRPLDGPPVPNSGKAAIRPDRTFVIENVLPGIYELQASYSFSTTEVTVGSSDITGIELEVSGQVRLTPNVRMDDSSPAPPGLMFRVIISPGRSMFGPFTGPAGLSMAPGMRWVFMVPPPGLYVASATSGGVDLLRNKLDVRPGAAPRTIDVVLTKTQPVGAPVVTLAGMVGRQAGVDVELVDVTSASAQPRLVSSTTTDAEGAFRFEGLRRGIYRINLPPIDRVANDIQIGGDDVRVEIVAPEGTRIVGGGAVSIYFGGKRMVLVRPARLTLVAEREGERTRIPIEFMGFWGALVPGAYRLTVEGLQPGFSVRSLAAGSVNLLEQPFVVPHDRPAEVIRLDLTYVAPH
jgi:hypothetical protein